MLILQFFFGGFVVSLLASIGVLQTPWLYGFVFRRHLAVSPVTWNRRPSDALGWDALLFGLPNAFVIWFISASYRRPALVEEFPALLRYTGLLEIGVFQTPLAGMRSYLPCLTPSSF